jgi:D-glycero-D-manno-heptose 1,7-bisphosphate phosphatase
VSLRPAVFTDRDGTLIVDRDYLHHPSEVEWIPGTLEAIARLNRAGFLVVVVTNQSGVARGLFSEAEVRGVHDHMASQAADAGARIDAFYYCPYHPEGLGTYRRAARCRKPDIGMYEQAISELAIDGSFSWMIGDKAEDMAFAVNAQLRAIRVQTGKVLDRSVDNSFEEVATFADAVTRVLR